MPNFARLFDKIKFKYAAELVIKFETPSLLMRVVLRYAEPGLVSGNPKILVELVNGSNARMFNLLIG